MWNEKVREALNVLFENVDNPQDVIAYMEEAAKAQAQADALDDAGFQRKAVSPDADAQTLHVPGGLLSEPGVENGKAMDPNGKCPTCGKQMKDGKCPDHGDMTGGEKKSLDAPPASAEPPKVTPPTGQERKKGLQPQSVAKTMLGQTRPLLTTDITEIYEAVSDIIETRVTKAIQDAMATVFAEVSKALKERDEYLADVVKQIEESEILKEAVLVQKAYDTVVDAINQHSEHLADVQVSQEKLTSLTEQLTETNVTPRITQIFKHLAASEAEATVIDDEHPLAKAHPAEIADGTFAKVGLKPIRTISGNGRAAS